MNQDHSSQEIRFNPNDLEGMIALMDAYGDSTTMFPGTNDNGETVHISIYHERMLIYWHKKRSLLTQSISRP